MTLVRLKLDNRGNVAVDRWMTSVPGVFAARKNGTVPFWLSGGLSQFFV
jgi:hypothetical protein